ncbi:MAG: TlpA disulfide reductase family protein [Acidimicrobiia bacterium]
MEVDSPEPARRRRNRWPLGMLTLLVVAVTVVAVVLLRDDTPPDDGVGLITVPDFGVRVGDVAPLFSIELIGGGRFSLTDHLEAGGGPVVLNLWASWCTPCREEMPRLDAASRRHPDVYFLGVAIEDDPAAARDFAAEIGVSYALAIDEADRVARRYPAFGLPATYLISSDGTIAQVFYGLMSEQQIADALATLD